MHQWYKQYIYITKDKLAQHVDEKDNSMIHMGPKEKGDI